jgi:hypothetical protein
MALEDRVITTEQLVAANSGDEIHLQLGAGLLRRLDPLGVHVLVPAGPLPGEAEPVICCQAHLRVAGEDEPLVVPTMITIDDFVTLPTAFEALGIAATLVPAMVSEIEVWAAGS